MKISGHAPDVLREEFRFFWILMSTGVVVPLSTAIGGYFIGRSRMLPNALSCVAGCLLNIVLDYAMIFGHWGFPRMGITGANPALFAKQDPAKVSRANVASSKASKPVMELITRHEINWTIVAAATPAWAALFFPVAWWTQSFRP